DAVEQHGDHEDGDEARDPAGPHHEPDRPLRAAQLADVERQEEERGEGQEEAEVRRRDAQEARGEQPVVRGRRAGLCVGGSHRRCRAPCRDGRRIIHAAHGYRTAARAATTAQAPPRAVETAAPRAGAGTPQAAGQSRVARRAGGKPCTSKRWAGARSRAPRLLARSLQPRRQAVELLATVRPEESAGLDGTPEAARLADQTGARVARYRG